MRKLKLVGALMLAILIMASCVSMSVLAEQNESPTDNNEKIEISNAAAPGVATQKAKKPRKGSSRKEKPNSKASEEELDQESPNGDDMIEEPKQESPDTQKPDAEEPVDANTQNDAPPEGDPASESTDSEQPKNEPEQQGKVFEITFVVEGDKTVVKLAEGDAIVKPQNDPVKKGHDFVHWYDASGSEKTEFGFGVGAKKDLELKALFKKIKSDDEDQIEDQDGDDPQSETTIEDLEVPLGSGAASDPIAFGNPQTDRSIVITSDRGNKVRYGDAITLTGKLNGFADEQYSLTWRHDNGNGAWTDYSQGSTKCTFVLDEQNINWNWQLVALIDG